ncbi:MAG: sulfurtransferase [Salinigranum sp.]
MTETREIHDSPLTPADWLESRLDDPSVRVIEIDSDTRGELIDYLEGHIPKAVRWHWREMLWHDTDREFPTPEEMAARLGNEGISEDDTIVLVSDRAQFATYAYWVFTMCGIQNVRILDIVHQTWVAEDRPLSRTIPRFEETEYVPGTGDQTPRVGRRNVRDNLDNPDRLLLDARNPEEYTGERVKPYGAPVDHGAHRWGRIPGAKHMFYREFLHDDDRYRTVEEMQEAFRREGIDLDEETREIVTYCRSSHRASFVWFLLTHLLDYDDVKVYDGSWTEWGSIVGYPVEP